MANPSQEDPKPDGAVFDEFFDSIGNKAEHVTNSEENGKKESHASVSNTEAAPTTKDSPDEEGQRVVDEIESLCMNCREMV